MIIVTTVQRKPGGRPILVAEDGREWRCCIPCIGLRGPLIGQKVDVTLSDAGNFIRARPHKDAA